MLMSAITLAFQLVCTKLVAKSESIEAKAAVFQLLHKKAWWVGIGLGTAMLMASSVLACIFGFPVPGSSSCSLSVSLSTSRWE